MLTLWLLLESSISKSPYLSRRANVFLPASATLARVSFLSRGGLFLVCGCKDRANSKYKPNLSTKKSRECLSELHSFSRKQDTYMGWKNFQYYEEDEPISPWKEEGRRRGRPLLRRKSHKTACPSPENLTTYPRKPILLRNPTNIGRKAEQYRSRHEAIELGG